MAIKCGRGNHYHDSVAEVRNCYNGGEAVSTPSTVPARDRLSQKQVNMVGLLMRKLNLVWVGETPVEELAKWGAGRELIDSLKEAEIKQARGLSWSTPKGTENDSKPKAESTERKPFPQISQGYYATSSATGNSDLDFW